MASGDWGLDSVGWRLPAMNHGETEMRQLTLCVNLTESRGAQVFGETLFQLFL